MLTLRKKTASRNASAVFPLNVASRMYPSGPEAPSGPTGGATSEQRTDVTGLTDSFSLRGDSRVPEGELDQNMVSSNHSPSPCLLAISDSPPSPGSDLVRTTLSGRAVALEPVRMERVTSDPVSPNNRSLASYSDRPRVGVPSMSSIESPARTPALSAGPPGRGVTTCSSDRRK